MDIRNLLKMLAPVAAVALTACLTGCNNSPGDAPGDSTVNIDINGDKGKPLADLDLTGPPPHSLVLLGPDKVTITTGDKLAITVDGDPATAAKLRFTLKGDTLGILRQNHSWSASDGVTVHVTMPAPSDLVMSGSGAIDAKDMAQKASVTIAGSGTVNTPSLGVDKLVVTIAVIDGDTDAGLWHRRHGNTRLNGGGPKVQCLIQTRGGLGQIAGG